MPRRRAAGRLDVEPDAVVLHPHDDAAVAALHREVDAVRLRVLGHVVDRLGGDAVDERP
jgi:hypothetical protein